MRAEGTDVEQAKVLRALSDGDSSWRGGADDEHAP